MNLISPGSLAIYRSRGAKPIRSFNYESSPPHPPPPPSTAKWQEIDFGRDLLNRFEPCAQAYRSKSSDPSSVGFAYNPAKDGRERPKLVPLRDPSPGKSDRQSSQNESKSDDDWYDTESENGEEDEGIVVTEAKDEVTLTTNEATESINEGSTVV